MSWSKGLMASLDTRATVLHTARGPAQVARRGQGPAVLSIHGGPGGFDFGLAYGRHLHVGGCEVIAPSRPGYLRTPLESGPSPEAQADLYAAVLDVLGIDRAAILGVSSGGPSAVHFAARHPDRTTALFLDAAILLPFQVPLSRLRQSTLESSFVVWLSHQLVTRRPQWMTRFAIDGMSQGLTEQQEEAAIQWIIANPDRLRSIEEQFSSNAPRRHRAAGWANDKANETDLAPLPFDDVAAPTLIAHGANDAIVSLEHATHAADRIDPAELVVVEEGHHLLALSRNYGPVAERQLELASA